MKRLIALIYFLTVASAFAGPPKYKLTVLAYMNGYHREDPAVTESINKMESVGSSESMAIVAEWGSLKTGKTRRLFIEKDSDPEVVRSKVLGESEEDMGKASTLEDFLLWGSKKYPSEKIIVVVGSLASGWPGLSVDTRTNSRITVPELNTALKSLAKLRKKKIELIAFDACMMSMLEVASELSPSVHYMAAGMNILPSDVWVPYDKVLGKISKSSDPKVWGETFAQIYYEQTKGNRHDGDVLGIQYGVIDLTKMARIEHATSKLATALLKLSPDDRKSFLSQAQSQSLKFFVPYYIDLTEWLNHMPKGKHFTELNRAATGFRSAVRKAVLFQAKTAYYPVASGMTISLVPADQYPVQDWEAKYKKLRWAQNSNWLSVLLQIEKERQH